MISIVDTVQKIKLEAKDKKQINIKSNFFNCFEYSCDICPLHSEDRLIVSKEDSETIVTRCWEVYYREHDIKHFKTFLLLLKRPSKSRVRWRKRVSRI